MKTIGVDIGGTKTAIAIIDDKNGKIYQASILGLTITMEWTPLAFLLYVSNQELVEVTS